VKEAVRERNLLIQNAPHYVKPLPTIIPIFHWFSGLLNAPLKFLGLLEKPSERGAIVIKIGLMLYDAYSGGAGIVPNHEIYSKTSTHQKFPDMHPDVIFAAKYYDGLLLAPERLCIDMILDAESENLNAHALNYLPATSSGAESVKLKDQITGESFDIYPRVVINASGPWIDLTNTRLGTDTSFIGGTKGSHLIVNNAELRGAIGDNEIFFENADGRIVLLSPFEDKVLLGTSDLPISDPDSARCTSEEIEYFFEMVDIVFPNIKISLDQVVFQFSGVRPLPAVDANTPGQISRDHHIQVIPRSEQNSFPIFSLVGGKWTSFRAFSEEAADKALNELGLPRKSSTDQKRIGGGKDYPESENESKKYIKFLSAEYEFSGERAVELFNRYGTRAAEFANSIPPAGETLIPGATGYTEDEIIHIIDNEKIVHLDDLILRRMNITKSGNLNLSALLGISQILGTYMHWSSNVIELEIQRTKSILSDVHGVVI
jgi:glycerol-3-phosphate dehydrogenase